MCEVEKASLQKLGPTRFLAANWFEAGGSNVTKGHVGCSVVAVPSPEPGSGVPISCPLSLGSLHSREAAHVLRKSLQRTLGCGVLKVEVGNLPGMGDGGRAHTWRPRDCVFVVFCMNSLTFKTMHLLLGLWFSNVSS